MVYIKYRDSEGEWHSVESGTGSGGAENSIGNPYSHVYFKDIINNGIYRVSSSNGSLISQNTNSGVKSLSSISATKTKLTYNMDEQILIDDVVVTATYSDNTTSVVTNWTSNVMELDTFTEGLRKLVITYSLDGISKSTTLYLNVLLSVSYNGKPYVTIVNDTGSLSNGVDLGKSLEKILTREIYNIRFKLKVTVSRNRSTTNTVIGLGNNAYWNTDTLNSITLLPYQVGEFLIEGNLEIAYPQSNTLAGASLIKLYCSNNNLEGKYELQQLSVAMIQPAEVILASISATKVTTRYFANDVISTSDISVTALYSDDTTGTVTNFTTNLGTLDLSQGGDIPLTIAYTYNGLTRYTSVNLYIYKVDLSSPLPFTITTAQQFADALNYGWNLGNNLDSWGSGDKTVYGEDRFPNQETAWGQPKIKRATFDLIKAQGFNTVRIPVSWFYNSYLDSNGNRLIGKYWKARVREVVDMALEAGFWVIINSHHDYTMFYAGTTDTRFAQVLKDISTVWTDIANKFKHYGEKLIFEGFNEIDNIEASWQYSAKSTNQLNQMNQAFVDTVRATGSNNANRILILQTLLGGTSSAILDAFEMPTDTVQNRLMVEVHTYSKLFLQNIDALFALLQSYSQKFNAPLIIGEYGTTNCYNDTKNTNQLTSDNLRPIHTSNFVARAKTHNIKTIWWDNGTTSTSKYDFALIDRFTNTIKYANIISAIKDGYDNCIAYKIPNQYIYTVTSIDQVVYLTLNKDTGVVSNTYWGHLTTDFISVVAGNTLTAVVNRSGRAATNTVALASIVFYDTNQEYLSGFTTAYQTISYNMVIPENAYFVKVCVNNPHSSLTLATFTDYLNTQELSIEISSYSMSLISQIDLDAPVVLNSISATKGIISYNVNDTVLLDDVVVTATYSDESVRTITDWTSNINSLDFSTVGNKVLIITYTEGATVVTSQIIITVSLLVLSSISVSKSVVNYDIGDTVSFDDVIVTALYENGFSRNITSWTSDANSFDFNTVGDKVITITYTEGGVTKTTQLTITIKAHTELSYLESNGTQCINTGIIGQTGLKIDIYWRSLGVTSGSYGIIGSRKDVNLQTFALMRSTNNIITTYNTLSYSASWHDHPIDFNVIKDDNLTYVNGTLKITDVVATFNNGFNMGIFAINHNGVFQNFETMRLYYCKIWDVNDVLLRDYVPVIKGGIYCLFDKVSQTYFYNQGTGSFTGV